MQGGLRRGTRADEPSAGISRRNPPGWRAARLVSPRRRVRRQGIGWRLNPPCGLARE